MHGANDAADFPKWVKQTKKIPDTTVKCQEKEKKRRTKNVIHSDVR